MNVMLQSHYEIMFMKVSDLGQVISHLFKLMLGNIMVVFNFSVTTDDLCVF